MGTFLTIYKTSHDCRLTWVENGFSQKLPNKKIPIESQKSSCFNFSPHTFSSTMKLQKKIEDRTFQGGGGGDGTPQRTQTVKMSLGNSLAWLFRWTFISSFPGFGKTFNNYHEVAGSHAHFIKSCDFSVQIKAEEASYSIILGLFQQTTFAYHSQWNKMEICVHTHSDFHFSM